MDYKLEEIISDIFLRILRRIPNDADVITIADQIRLNPVNAIEAMLDSPELVARLIQRDVSGQIASNCLSHLVTYARPEDQVTKKFFLHVPKTAGTSIQAHLNEHSTNLWARTENSLSKPNFELWPQWIEHYPLSGIPTSVKVFSVTRDPIARLVSAWLFYTSESQIIETNRPKDRTMSFTTFLKTRNAANLVRGHDFYFWPNKYKISKQPVNESDYVEKNYKNLSERFAYIASIEIPSSIEKLLKVATNASAPFLIHHNTTDEIIKSEPKSISNDEYLSLFQVTKLEYALMRHLYQNGMIEINYCKDIEKRTQKMLLKKNIIVN
jgi:hypothetical protein